MLRRAARLLRRVGDEPRLIELEMEEALDGALRAGPIRESAPLSELKLMFRCDCSRDQDLI